MLLLYFSSNVQCFCVPANTLQTSCLWIVRLSMPYRSSEGIFKRLNWLLQSIATFSYDFCDIWGSHWHWEWGICRNLVFGCRCWQSMIIVLYWECRMHKFLSSVFSVMLLVYFYRCPVALFSGNNLWTQIVCQLVRLAMPIASSKHPWK